MILKILKYLVLIFKLRQVVLGFLSILSISLSSNAQTCSEVLLSTSTIDQRYETAVRTYTDDLGFSNEFFRANFEDSAENRIMVRGLLTESFQPFFEESAVVGLDSKDQVHLWLSSNHDLLESILLMPTIGPSLVEEGPFRDEILKDINTRHPYHFEVSSIWSHLVDEGSFKFGADVRSAKYFRKLMASVYYIVSRLDYSWFGDIKQTSPQVLDRFTYTSTQLTYMVDFVLISYLHSLSFLNRRPEEFKNLSDLEWLKLLLLPQGEEGMSLVEKLSLAVRPEALGKMSTELYYIENPLVVGENGQLEFSQDMKSFFRSTVERWKQKGPQHTYELGTGCPAAFCTSTSDKSSLRIMSENIISIFSKVDTYEDFPGSGFYDSSREATYLRGDKLRNNLNFMEPLIKKFLDFSSDAGSKIN